MSKRGTFRYTAGKKATMQMAVPPKQAIRAGWKLLRLGIWYWITRRDVWVSTGFVEK